ncbi:hypothetical protein PINS_up003559 [Pythium insidiosum]|nr:hypothetical protein PINS_up003559 [Pythium insidiosum]
MMPQYSSRLYALAESRDKWIRRQQKAKRAEEMKEQENMAKLELAAKSKHIVAHRTNGGYAHIGERLYEEALARDGKARSGPRTPRNRARAATRLDVRQVCLC